MARSVRHVCTACAATLPVAVLCTGCVSTQTIAARARLVDARIRAGQTVTRVARANPDVSVGHVAVIHGRGGVTAIVVPVRNDSSRAVSDLPISVGVRTASGRRVYLNTSASADYFESHVASLGPGAGTKWVFTTGRRPPTGRAFAMVGVSTLRPSVTGLPRIVVSSRAGAAADHLTVSVVSHSAIPQYDLPLYVVAARGGRSVAAGQAAVAHLGSNGHATVSVGLVGDSRRAAVHVIALPTIFN